MSLQEEPPVRGIKAEESGGEEAEGLDEDGGGVGEGDVSEEEGGEGDNEEEDGDKDERSETDAPSSPQTKSRIEPTEISSNNIVTVMSALETSNPLLKEYLNIARTSLVFSNLRFFLSTNQSGVFLSITNNHPDLYLLFRNNLNLIIRSSGPDLFCTLYNYKHQVFKGMVIKDFQRFVTDAATKAGIYMFLKELDKDRYRVCSGAFTENEMHFFLNKEIIKSVLVEKFEGSIIYRSRDCFALVPSSVGEESRGCGTSSCECCLKLKLELASNSSLVGKAKVFETDGGENETALSSFVEVCMDSDNEESFDSLNISHDNYDKENYEDGENSVYNALSRRNQHQQQRNLQVKGFSKVKTTKVSYKKLIISAILSSPHNKLKLTEIYDWILERYPQFNDNKTGFQNSIRHNLSLNRIFVKVAAHTDYSSSSNKGSYWTIEPSELKIQRDWTINDKDPVHQHAVKGKALGSNFKIKLPPKTTPSEIVRKNLSISSRFVAIAPKPSTEQPLAIMHEKEGDDDDKEPGELVIDEKSELMKEGFQQLPDNLKQQLKRGLPIILRPLERAGGTSLLKAPTEVPPTSLPIIIQPASVISLSPVITSGSGPTNTSAATITLLPRPSATLSTSATKGTEVPKLGPLSSSSLLRTNSLVASPTAGASPKQLNGGGASLDNVVATSVGSNEFPKPPFSYKELSMISIFFSPTKQMSISGIYDHVKLWFPFYRQTSIGTTWMNSIRHNLSLNKVFTRVQGGKWMFDESDEIWRRLIVSNKWFETPVDADLFEHMARNCPEFQQKVYSKKSMFKSVPITVKTDLPNNEEEGPVSPEEPPPAKKIKTEDGMYIKEEQTQAEDAVEDPDEMEEDPDDDDEDDPLRY